MPRQIEIFFYGLFMDRDVLRENGFGPPRRDRPESMMLRCGSARARRWCLIPVNACTGC
jgi:hypothetical protein